jgi:hypothetical protein
MESFRVLRKCYCFLLNAFLCKSSSFSARFNYLQCVDRFLYLCLAISARMALGFHNTSKSSFFCGRICWCSRALVSSVVTQWIHWLWALRHLSNFPFEKLASFYSQAKPFWLLLIWLIELPLLICWWKRIRYILKAWIRMTWGVWEIS